jgi:hypothetical protein
MAVQTGNEACAGRGDDPRRKRHQYVGCLPKSGSSACVAAFAASHTATRQLSAPNFVFEVALLFSAEESDIKLQAALPRDGNEIAKMLLLRLPYLQGMPLSLKSLFRRRWGGLHRLQRKHACRVVSGLQLAVRVCVSMLCR